LHVLRTKTHFRRYRGRGVKFSYFALPDSCSVVSRAPSPVFIFCTPRPDFDVTEGASSSFQVLRSWARFQLYHGRRVQFSCFTHHDPFSAVPRVSGPVFIFYATGPDFGGTEGADSIFRGRRVQFLCFALLDPFSAVMRARSPAFMFCFPRTVFDGTDVNGSSFHVMRSRTRVRWYRGRRVQFSYFAVTDPFSAVPRASGPFFMFCAPELIFDGNEGAESCFHVLLFVIHSMVPMVPGPVFLFYAP
jgi:hypothetical protein